MVTEHDLSNLETRLRGEFQRCVHKAAHELRLDQIRQDSDIRILGAHLAGG